ncbi:MAG: diguanylate cyclase [Xanthomonadaceae bacterium]|nr:diguanylate cyclase [Xanthomonadaceae bacterium]
MATHGNNAREPEQTHVAPGGTVVRLRRWCGLLMLAYAAAVAAQIPVPVRGAPLLERYSADSVGATPRNFAAAHDAQGRLYVANFDGVLRFDGDTWELLRLPGAVAATALTRGEDGRIYVGGFDVFGVIADDADGAMRLQVLSATPPPQVHAVAIANVWQIIADRGALRFRTEFAMYTFDPALGTQRAQPLPDTTRMFFATRHGLLGRISGRGLVRMADDGSLQDLAGGARFADQGVAAIIDQGENGLVVSDDGLHRLRDDRVLAAGDSFPEFVNNHPNTARLLGDGSIAVGTTHGELLRYDANLKLLDRLKVNDGTIEDLHVDAENGLWVIGEGELVRIRLPAPWTFYGPAHGLRGSVYAAEWYHDALWLAGTAGLARIASHPGAVAQAQSLPWFEYEGYALQSTRGGLLIAHRSGLLVVNERLQRRTLISGTQAVLWLIPEPARDDRLYAVGEQTLWVLALKQGEWQIQASTELGAMSPNKVFSGIGHGELWFADSRSTPQRWRFDPETGALLAKHSFASAQGLPDVRDPELNLYRLDDRIHAVVGGQTYVLADERFVAERGAPASLVERPTELIVRDTPVGTFAATSRELYLRPERAQRWDRLRFGASAVRGFAGIHVGSDSIVRIATWSGLLQYDPSQQAPQEPALAVSLSQVSARAADGTLRQLPRRTDAAAQTIAAGETLRFRFALVTMEPAVEFRYRVHGLVPDWTEWRSDRELILRQPRGGDYSLEVQARTRSGREASPMFYRFHVEPRWNQTLWAKWLGAVLALALVLGIAQLVAWWRTKRFRATNALLESRIAERTRELEVVNRKLAELATEDSLTGISNRRALESGLAREWHRCLDQRRPIAALMIDVDHFKRFNDHHGHLEGDALLRRIAQVLQQFHDPARELLARFGGEEFALILPGVHLEEAQRRAQNLCNHLRDAAVPVTVSVGVAAQVPSPLDDPHLLLRRADAALYRAKRNGRDRVEIAND